MEEPQACSFCSSSSKTCLVWALMSPSKCAPTPERKRRLPYDTAGLNNCGPSGTFPLFHQTFLPVLDFAAAVPVPAAAATAAVALFPIKFRRLDLFGIEFYCKVRLF